MNAIQTPPALPRWKRVAEKAALRAQLAWQCLTTFEDAVDRSVLKVSFAQNGEDLIAWHALHALGLRRPRYLDIGAHDPVRLSNTALFHLLGGRGMNIEPDPTLFAAFPAQRPRDLNLNVGIGPVAGEMTFFRMTDPLLNTFSADEAARLEREEHIRIADRIPIRIEKIDTLLDHWDFTPDFLTLDTGGHDLAILQSYDFTRRRPAVICVETLTFSTCAQGRKIFEIADFLVSTGYRVHADTQINTLFVDERRRPSA